VLTITASATGLPDAGSFTASDFATLLSGVLEIAEAGKGETPRSRSGALTVRVRITIVAAGATTVMVTRTLMLHR